MFPEPAMNMKPRRCKRHSCPGIIRGRVVAKFGTEYCSPLCKEVDGVRFNLIDRLEQAELGGKDTSGWIERSEALDEVERALNEYANITVLCSPQLLRVRRWMERAEQQANDE